MEKDPNCMQGISDDVNYKVRRVFVAICNGNTTQATILSILEAKTNERMASINRLRKEKNLPVYLTVEEFNPESLFIRMTVNEWAKVSFGTLSKFLIASESVALVKAGFIEKEKNQRKKDKAFYYRLNIGRILEAVDAFVTLEKSAINSEIDPYELGD